MDQHPQLWRREFDMIIFNFPHAGATYGSSNEHVSWYIECHKRLVSGFFNSARHLLAEDGEIHVTHKTGHPYDSWNVVRLAEDVGLVLRDEVEFDIRDYPGYLNRKGYGSKWNATFPSKALRLSCSATRL